MEDRLAAQYQRRFEIEHEQRLAVWRTLIDAWFNRYLVDVDSILDLGCGWGSFVNQIDVRDRYAIDLNPDAGRRVDSSVELFMQPASARWPLPDASLDLVFTSNFLEHLETRKEIASTLAEAYRCLRPRARMVCLGPNIRYAGAAYWDFFDHVVPLTERSLVEALEVAGFETELVIPRFLPYTMAGKRAPRSLAIRTYLRCPPMWRLLGKQFLVVVGKPARLDKDS